MKRVVSFPVSSGCGFKAFGAILLFGFVLSLPSWDGGPLLILFLASVALLSMNAVTRVDGDRRQICDRWLVLGMPIINSCRSFGEPERVAIDSGRRQVSGKWQMRYMINLIDQNREFEISAYTSIDKARRLAEALARMLDLPLENRLSSGRTLQESLEEKFEREELETTVTENLRQYENRYDISDMFDEEATDQVSAAVSPFADLPRPPPNSGFRLDVDGDKIRLRLPPRPWTIKYPLFYLGVIGLFMWLFSLSGESWVLSLPIFVFFIYKIMRPYVGSFIPVYLILDSRCFYLRHFPSTYTFRLDKFEDIFYRGKTLYLKMAYHMVRIPYYFEEEEFSFVNRLIYAAVKARKDESR